MNDCWPLTLLAGSQTIVVNFDDLIFEKLAISYDCVFYQIFYISFLLVKLDIFMTYSVYANLPQKLHVLSLKKFERGSLPPSFEDSILVLSPIL